MIRDEACRSVHDWAIQLAKPSVTIEDRLPPRSGAERGGAWGRFAVLIACARAPSLISVLGPAVSAGPRRNGLWGDPGGASVAAAPLRLLGGRDPGLRPDGGVLRDGEPPPGDGWMA
jgi:hypothetical protein